MKFKVGDYLKRLAPYGDVYIKLGQIIGIDESYHLKDLRYPKHRAFHLSKEFVEKRYELSSKEECQMLLMKESLNGNNS